MAICTVIGAGNGGQAFAAVLKNKDHVVRLWDIFPETVQRLNEVGEIRLTGTLDLQQRLDLITGDTAEALAGAEYVLVAVPAHYHGDIAREIAAHVNPDQIVVLNPGRTAGALHFKSVLERAGVADLPVIAENQTFPLTCRAIAIGHIDVLAEKKENWLAALPQAGHFDLTDRLSSIYPNVRDAGSTMATGLGNIGAILHPAPTLLNTGWIESRTTFFAHYYSGISPSIAAFLEKMDAERLAVAAAYGCDVPDVKSWHEKVYGKLGTTLYETLQSNRNYASIDAPANLDHRYLHEDIATGLVPISELGKLVDVPTPCLDLIIDLAWKITDTDFRKNGRNLDVMGLRGKSRAEVIELF